MMLLSHKFRHLGEEHVVELQPLDPGIMVFLQPAEKWRGLSWELLIATIDGEPLYKDVMNPKTQKLERKQMHTDQALIAVAGLAAISFLMRTVLGVSEAGES